MARGTALIEYISLKDTLWKDEGWSMPYSTSCDKISFFAHVVSKLKFIEGDQNSWTERTLHDNQLFSYFPNCFVRTLCEGMFKTVQLWRQYSEKYTQCEKWMSWGAWDEREV